ncbi:disintegrin and metalloproteinase domain-containing protein 20-like [Suncus etruscus]|uniref:disintegrin and metalloproteinase domain-containing protein 20-like n=1 Tax=Suncus etruscus TaxID=109475 RepID=UPI0021106673|nr:disintegrin and metalloproteinase domain-containing protein 20-like [Suncus etruscus]
MAVDEEIAHFKAIFLLLVHGMCLFISVHSQSRPTQKISSPELVIPLKVAGRGRSARVMDSLSYSIRFGGQRHVIHLTVKKHLISRQFQVFTYVDQRTLQQDRPFVPADCYYHGYVEGVSQSLVSLSTCSGGFQGMLLVNDQAYEIQPVMFSSTFEHLMYKIDKDDMEFPPKRCGLTDEKIIQQLRLLESFNFTLRQSANKEWWTHLRYVEMFVVVDHYRFLHSYGNVSVAQQEVFYVVNIVDSVYQALTVEVSLAELEIWSLGNIIPILDINKVLPDFVQWKFQNRGAVKKLDASHFFVKQGFGRVLGLAYVGTICRFPFNSGVESFPDNNRVAFAFTVAHELGHNLGMAHDVGFCSCEVDYCIMYPSRQLTTKFSNCSYSDYWNTALRSGDCLLNPHQRQENSDTHFCGNLVVEFGEQCDCGTIYQCSSDHCCRTNCTLKPGAECSQGMCCKDCKFSPSGTLCRQQVNECDLPEWCTGHDSECPEDTFVQNGTPCKNSSLCFLSRCTTTHDMQCKELFGNDARTASEQCFQEVNIQGNRFGHCGMTNHLYIGCSFGDILCGRLQCENVKVIPDMTQHTTLHQFPINGTTCWGTDFHPGMGIPDTGLVKDGTDCGPNMVCQHQRCIGLDNYCNLDACHNNGICNSKHNCHCFHGWAPPRCNIKGFGGSIDSGPAPQSLRRDKSKLAYLTMLWIIPVTLFILYGIHFRREHKPNKTKEKEDPQKEEKKDTEKSTGSGRD